jgi:hypothetical protein
MTRTEMTRTGERTVGNHSYVDVFEKNNGQYVSKDLYDRLSLKEAIKLLIIIDKFEKEHPELQITNWRAEYHIMEGENASIQGIWIDHKPVV